MARAARSVARENWPIEPTTDYRLPTTAAGPARRESYILRLAGIFTWLAVGVPRLFMAFDPPWLAAWVVFGAMFWIGSSERAHQWPRGTRIAIVVLQSLLAMTATWLHPNPFMPVLFVIVAGAVAGNLRSLASALTWICFNTIVIAAIFAFHGSAARDYVPVTAAWFAFQVFALLAVHLVDRESCARQELAIANAELRSAADLLDASSRANERLRIARDLHDLLGHHLTALSVNLEVASHLTGGKAKEHVEHAQSLAKLLLSDVRAVVSDLRDDQTIDVASMLRRTIDPVPSPKIDLNVQSDLRIADAAIAQSLLRAVQEIVTNAIRHSGASLLTIDVFRKDGAIELRALDDGRGVTPIRDGNGLRGIRERAEAAGGHVEYRSARGAGFQVSLTLPLAEDRV